MQRRRILIEQAVSTLADLHSFLKAGRTYDYFTKPNPLDAFDCFLNAEGALGVTEALLGVYFNEVKHLDCLIITDKGIHAVTDQSKQYIPYESIDAVTAPGDDDRHLDVGLKNGDWIILSVLGDTEGDSDVPVFYDFLTELLNLPEEIVLDLETIRTQKDLTAHLNRIGLEDLGAWFECEIDKSLTRRKIDLDLLKHPDIWRFCALILSDQAWNIEDL